ncbi:MAG: glutamate--tRNA ligase [Acidilobus sp.]
MSSEDLRTLVYRATLRNAVQHEGKAQVNSVMSSLMAEKPELRRNARELAQLVKEMVDKVNSMSLDEQREALEREFGEVAEGKRRQETERKSLPPLPNAEEGKVVTRFAPNPDFAIHIGNARPAILSYEYARIYKGRMVLRFEDTDPRTKTPMKEAYDMIREDLRWLGIKWDEEYIQSLRMEIFYSTIREALSKGCAYVDLGKDESKKLIAEKGAPEYRNMQAEWQLEQFDKMLSGHYKEGDAVIRFKTNLEDPNPSLRDWVAFRIIDTSQHPHPLTGDKYIVWPTYNFAVSVDDHLMGITHVLRGKEHQLNTLKQSYVYRCFGWQEPTYIHFGRLKLEGFIMSKSYIKKIMSESSGEFMGLDDPRFGTIAGLRRRGILPESIRDVILDVGVRPGDAKLSWANLAATNRKKLDPMADRLMFVETSQGRGVRVRLSQQGCVTAKIPLHPNRPQAVREIKVCDGDNIYVPADDLKSSAVRLAGLGNYTVRLSDGMLVFKNDSLDEARREGYPIIQWVPERSAVNIRVLEPDGLKLVVHEGLVEGYVGNYTKGSRLQFIRFGFVIIDSIKPLTAILTHR